MVDLTALAGGDLTRARRLDRLATANGGATWEVIRAHGLVDGRWLDDAAVRVLYVHLTDQLIHTITGGGFDRIVYLDKSARPVGWLVRDLWDLLAVEFDTEGRVRCRYERPALTFLNIDREQWRTLVDPEGVGELSVGRIERAVIDGLRRGLLRSPRDQRAQGDELAAAPTLFDDQQVLVVDEVSVSGATGALATGLLGAAIPEASFTSAHWMRPKMVKGADGNTRNNLLPVWYREDTALGRGVGDRDDAASAASPHWRVRALASFISRPHPPSETDEPGRQLRREIGWLAGGVARGEIPVVPDIDRDDAEERCRFFNGHGLVENREWREQAGVVLRP